MSREQVKTLWDKLSDIPEQYIYLVLAVLLIAPLIRPLGLPLLTSWETRKFFKAIDELKPGDIVFYAFDAGSMTWMEQGLGATIVMRHLLMKPGVRIVGATIGPEGPMFWEQTLTNLNYKQYGKVYGKDIVWLGFFAGTETACAALASDLQKATGGRDAYGNRFEDLPLMQEAKNAKSFKILVVLSWGGTWQNWMNQWQMPYGIPEYVIPLAGVAGAMRPYIEAGQISSVIVGARGAAEYEILLGKPGRAAAGMDAQSFGHIYVALLILIGNLAYFAKRYGGKSK
jgi:hypothetical protein